MAVFSALGPYKILRRLGRGGMGDVYLAEDTRKPEADPNRRIALKVMHRDDDPSSSVVIQAERQGAQLQARLYAIETRVARINCYDIIEDTFFIDMEYIDGRDLSEAIKEGPMKLELALHIAHEVADILTRCHTLRFEHETVDSRGVIHGDIKPRNIRLGTDGRVRLMDFGIAKALSMTRKLTRNEFGSVSYASPERLENGQVDLQSDLWSLAVVLYEMLTGRTPFEAENTRKIEQAILQGAVRIPLPTDTPSEVRAFLSKALALKAEGRYASASHFKLALKGLLNQLRQGTTSAANEDLQKRAAYASSSTQETAPVSRPASTDLENIATVKVAPVTRPTLSPEGPAEEQTRRTTRPIETSSSPTPLSSSSDSAPLNSPRMESVSPQAEQDEATRKTLPPKKKRSWLSSREDTDVVINREETAPVAPPIHDAAALPQQTAEAGTLQQMSPTEPVALAEVERVFPPPWLSYVVVILTLFGGGYLVFYERGLEQDSEQLKRSIQSNDIRCNVAFQRYEKLLQASLLGSAGGDLKAPLESLCRAELEILFTRYYDLNPKLDKDDWSDANLSSKHLLTLNASQEYQAWEQYTAGQRLRIAKKFDEAVAVLVRASELHNFCDPFLALMHMYAYSERKDLSHFMAAQEQAASRGCSQPKYAIWQADIQFDTAEQKLKEVDANADDAVKLQAYQETKALYEAAVSVYRQNLKIGNSKKLARDGEKRIKQLQGKIHELESPIENNFNYYEQLQLR
ncbi:MAG: serine/threonine protein kinase [Myxococcota bacterium]